MPFAQLSARDAKHYLKFDPFKAESTLGYIPNSVLLDGSDTFYKFENVQKYAELKFGKG